MGEWEPLDLEWVAVSFEWEPPDLEWEPPDLEWEPLDFEWEPVSWEVGEVPTLDSEKRVAVVPGGVVVCAEAVDCLNRAIDALGLGLPVRAWAWAVRAVDVLDAATGGEVREGANVGNGKETAL